MAKKLNNAVFDINFITETLSAMKDRDSLREVREYLAACNAPASMIATMEQAMIDVAAWIDPEIERAALDGTLQVGNKKKPVKTKGGKSTSDGGSTPPSSSLH